MAFEDSERTQPATPRRRQEARERGQVARSVEVNSALILLGTFGALAIEGANTGRVLLMTFEKGLALPGRVDLTPEAVRELFLWVAAAVGRAIVPVALAAMVTGVLANILQVGFYPTSQAIQLNWARVSPMRGLSNLLSLRGGAELAKAILKLTILGTVAYRTLQPEWAHFPELVQMDLLEVLAWELGLGLRLGLKVALAYCGLAALDYAFQRWQHEKSLRMSRAEVQEEARMQEGDPQIRARVRSVQRERARRRMMEAVPTATAVVVNPTHIAVALKYDAKTMRAPRVVAKGMRRIAERIVAIARAHGVPVVQDIPLAHALEKLVGVDAEIPVALYRAVAGILAYVYAKDSQRKMG